MMKCRTVKAIIECGALGSQENIVKASIIARLAGAHFVKTSTGTYGVV